MLSSASPPMWAALSGCTQQLTFILWLAKGELSTGEGRACLLEERCIQPVMRWRRLPGLNGTPVVPQQRN